MEIARLTGVKIAAHEKEISDLNDEYRALAEQTRLTPTPTPVATPVETPPLSVQGDDAAEGGEGPMNSVLGFMMRWVLMCVRTQSHRLRLTLKMGRNGAFQFPRSTPSM